MVELKEMLGLVFCRFKRDIVTVKEICHVNAPLWCNK